MTLSFTKNINDLDTNPGRQLQLLLKEIYPPDSNSKMTFISKIDNAVKAEGKLEELIYDSTINYLVRRLITFADYLNRRYDHRPENEYIGYLRKFIRDETELPQKHIEKILILLMECVKIKKKRPTDMTLKRIRRVARTKGESCYICGGSLEFATISEVSNSDNLSDIEKTTSFRAAEVDHIWPNAMGGINDDTNLRVSCMRCNKIKMDFIDASDFHYEEISLVSQKGDTHFSNELSHKYKVALWARSNYCCIICGKPATYVGELQFGRRNPNDSWHFLNIDAYCEQHVPE